MYLAHGVMYPTNPGPAEQEGMENGTIENVSIVKEQVTRNLFVHQLR